MPDEVVTVMPEMWDATREGKEMLCRGLAAVEETATPTNDGARTAGEDAAGGDGWEAMRGEAALAG